MKQSKYAKNAYGAGKCEQRTRYITVDGFLLKLKKIVNFNI